MARLSLHSRKLKQRKKSTALLLFWMHVFNVVNWFMKLTYHMVEYQVHKYTLKNSYNMSQFTRLRSSRIRELIFESDSRCIDHLRVDRHTFSKLCTMLKTVSRMTDSRYLSLEEQVACFLNILAHHVKNRVIQNNFKRSGWTVSKYFNKVLNGVVQLHRELLKIPTPIEENSRDERWKWFKMDSPQARGRGKNKRQWSEEEDDALIVAMRDLCSTGKYKADNGFRPGFPLALEEALEAKMPGCNLKAQPHINSRIRHFRTVFGIIHDMVVGKSTSGFGWDSTTKSVTAPKEVWKEYLKGHPKAREYRDKSCPYYEDLCMIFGKDRASGKDAQGPEDLEDDVNREEMDNASTGRDEHTESSSTQIGGALPNSSVPSKRQRTSDNLVKGITEAASILGKEIRAATSELSRAVSNDVMLSEKRSKINEELLKLQGLTMIERHRAGRKIASDQETTDMFFSIVEEEKEEWVSSLLKGEI